MKPSFEHGNGIGRIDEEIIPYLPETLKIIVGAGAGYNWVDVDKLAEAGGPSFEWRLTIQGILYCNGAGGATEATSDIALYLYESKLEV